MLQNATKAGVFVKDVDTFRIILNYWFVQFSILKIMIAWKKFGCYKNAICSFEHKVSSTQNKIEQFTNPKG